MSATAGGSPSTIVGQATVAPGRGLWIQLAASVAFAIWAVSARDHFLPLFYLAGSAYMIWLRRRPPTVVSPAGIKRPWRRRSSIDWTQVESIAAVQPGVWACRVNLVGGQSVALEDIAAANTAAVAAIGVKPVVALPRPVPPVREPTAAQAAAEVTRRAAALAEQRRQLAARSRQLRGDRADSDTYLT